MDTLPAIEIDSIMHMRKMSMLASDANLNHLSKSLTISNDLLIIGAVLTLLSAALLIREGWRDARGTLRNLPRSAILAVLAAVIVVAGTAGAIHYGDLVSDVKEAEANARIEEAKQKASEADQHAQEAKHQTALVEAQNIQLESRQDVTDKRVTTLGKDIQPWVVEVTPAMLARFRPYNGRFVMLAASSLNPDGAAIMGELSAKLGSVFRMQLYSWGGPFVNPVWNRGVHIYYDSASRALAEQFAGVFERSAIHPVLEEGGRDDLKATTLGPDVPNVTIYVGVRTLNRP